jgi:very-long-chain (3R)-3-hydroxyacyl-CoA dehydratase
MVIAWSVTEVIRYSNYVATLLGVRVAPLEWLRFVFSLLLHTKLRRRSYTLFYIMYPIGAGSEATFIYHAAPFAAAKFGEPARYAAYALSFVGWPLGACLPGQRTPFNIQAALSGLMSYMHSQRRKHLGSPSVNTRSKGKKRA